MNIKITIKPENFSKKIGAVDLNRSLKKAVAIISTRLEAGGKEKATELIYQTPESPNYRRTGWLRRSIISNSQGLKGWVRAMAFYSEYVHEGTKRMAARPFFTDAVDSLKRELEKETGSIIEIDIERQLK